MKFTMSIAMQPPEHYAPLAQEAEKLGWSSVAVPESIFWSEEVSANYPYTPDGSRFWEPSTPFVEPWVAIATMAAVTSKIRFYTNVIKMGVRHPLLVAKTVSSAAVISNNRVGLGIGLGWQPEEFKWCGTEYKGRGKRVNEAIECLDLLLNRQGELVEYHGDHYDFGRLRLSPAPSEPVPFYVGGHSKPGLRRAAKYADGWTSAMTTTAKLQEFIANLTALRQEYGRDHLPFEIQAVALDAFDADGIRRLADIGVTDFITMPWAQFGVAVNGPLEDKIGGLREYTEKICNVVNG